MGVRRVHLLVSQCTIFVQRSIKTSFYASFFVFCSHFWRATKISLARPKEKDRKEWTDFFYFWFAVFKNRTPRDRFVPLDVSTLPHHQIKSNYSYSTRFRSRRGVLDPPFFYTTQIHMFYMSSLPKYIVSYPSEYLIHTAESALL
jgi:hypothetical protein